MSFESPAEVRYTQTWVRPLRADLRETRQARKGATVPERRFWQGYRARYYVKIM